MKYCLVVLLPFFFFPFWEAYCQETFPRNDVKDLRTGQFAFTNATIHADFQTVFENATLLIREGKIEKVGTDLNVPDGYVTIDLKGKYIYPSFIDAYTNYGLSEVTASNVNRFMSAEQIESSKKGAYNANQAINSHFHAADEFSIDPKSAGELRKAGFGTVLTSKPDGIARGTGALVTLNEKNENTAMLRQKASAHYSLEKGTSTQSFPLSIMGAIALIRQTYLDAEWFANQSPRPFADNSLEGWIQNKNLPQIFATTSWLNLLRADKLGDESGVQYVIKGTGDEYKRIKEVKNTNASLIVPVYFPDPYEVEDPFDEGNVSFAEMKHWELAPKNPAILEQNGINFSLTAAGLKKTEDFFPNLRKAISLGLSESTALKALTTTPAQLLQMDDLVGSLKQGMLANFIITSGKLFEEKTIIYQNWIQGDSYSINPIHLEDFSGNYDLLVGEETYQLEVRGEPGKQQTKIIINDSTTIEVNSNFSRDLIQLSFQPKKPISGSIRLAGWKEDAGWKGQGQLIDGTWVSWSGKRTGDLDALSSPKVDEKENEDRIGEVIFPFIAHGFPALPEQQTLLIKNATVWTNESEGILENTDVLLKDGKISRIGKGLADDSAILVDGSGKHLTAGIIDEHSHIGASSINDGATNTSMVRIGDVIDSEAINIYRALAGGVVALQILHGSANPIGGQSALIKLRWGESPENYKIEGADGYIKFALGENVKRSYNPSSVRFPQSRMGVEQVFMDAFTNARAYEKKWDTFNNLTSREKSITSKPRRDLVDETMLEILNGVRFISCHSYVQSEINMLMKVAEQFGFRINTFTHILEGYKVADKMAAHGVAASTFSDWWNYKWEVRYAIPYNAAIMQRAGVLTAINSDDAEMGRRLNQEAAKSVKYGGMSEEDAWKMVTLNPAKILHLDDRMGSIKIGKSADVVLWNDHPLSVYAKVIKTIIDGKVYFDIEKDRENNVVQKAERLRLIQKMKEAKKSGKSTQKGEGPQQVNFQCEDIVGLAMEN